jgi:threonine aldolase
LFKAIAECNEGHAPSYGTDQYSEKAINLFRELFGAPVDVFFVFNGTAANVVAMRACAKSFHSVLTSDVSHLNTDECGAPEFMTGAKYIPIKSTQGKISWSEIEKHLVRLGDQHFSQPKVLSLSQPTELGTCYSLEELKHLVTMAHKNNLVVHVDGARLANAVVSQNTSFKEMITDIGVDILSFGGTKNGFLMGEAIVVLNKTLSVDLKYLRKQSCQLPSKTRFIAAQFISYLQNNVWREIAVHSNKMASRLRAAVEKIPAVTITTETQSNAVFAQIPKSMVKPLREKFFFYIWDEHTFECRWMASWDTTTEDVDQFANFLKELS